MMVARILLLLLYFNLCSSVKREYKIDISRCEKDMKCFVRESCIPSKTDVKNLVLYDRPIIEITGETAIVHRLKEDCDAIIQIKSYTAKKYFIMMQVDASKGDASQAPDITADEGVSFIQGADGAPERIQFQCTADNKPTTQNANLVIDPESSTTRYENKVLFCAFFLTTTDDEEISSKFTATLFKPTLMYTTDSGNKIEYIQKRDNFWNKAKSENCDPDLVLPSSQTDDSFVYLELDSYLVPPFNCDSSLYLRIVVGDAAPVMVPGGSLSCDEKTWQYKLADDFIDITEPFTAHCVMIFCSLCDALKPISCDACESFTAVAAKDAENGCTTVTCPNNEWLLDGKAFVGEVECRRDAPDDATTASWYAKGGTDKVQGATCLKQKNICWANIVDTCPSGADAALIPADLECDPSKLQKSKDSSDLTCADGAEMRYLSAGALNAATKLICDFVSKKFKDGANEVELGSSVICLRKKVAGETKGAPQTSGVDAVVVVVPLAVALIGAGALVAIIILRKRNARPSRTKKTGSKSTDQPASGGTSSVASSGGTASSASSVKQPDPAATPSSSEAAAAAPKADAPSAQPKTT